MGCIAWRSGGGGGAEGGVELREGWSGGRCNNSNSQSQSGSADIDGLSGRRVYFVESGVCCVICYSRVQRTDGKE